MPSRFRDALSASCDGKMIVTVDFEGHCLTMHPLPDWQAIEQKLLAMPTLNPQTRRLQRMVAGWRCRRRVFAAFPKISVTRPINEPL